MMEQHKINLIVYHRYDINPYPWTIDLGFITHEEQLGYSLRCTRSSCGYNLRDIGTADPNQDKSHEEMEVTQTEMLQSPDTPCTSEEPLDMSVRNKVLVKTPDDTSVQANIVPNVHDNIIDSSL